MDVGAAESSTLEWALKRDRRVVVGALVAVIAFSWAYVLAGAGMREVPGAGGAMAAGWRPGDFALMLAMWWGMMVAMMLPSAAPTILLFAAVNRKNGERGHPVVPTSLFAAGYVVAWGAFSVLATLLQWSLDRLALLTPTMESASLPLGAALLIAAGIYQMTPLKHACLRHCRSPIQFLGHRWRRGTTGAVLMGLEHGSFCLGCCWVLMGILFYGGVMNLLWIGGLALYVLAEKLAPAGHWIGRFGGAALLLWGAVILVRYAVSA